MVSNINETLIKHDSQTRLAKFFWDKFPLKTAALLDNKKNEGMPFCLRLHHKDRNVIIEAMNLLKNAFDESEIKITSNIKPFFENNEGLIAKVLRTQPVLTFRITHRAIGSGSIMEFFDSIESQKISSPKTPIQEKACMTFG